LFLSFFLLSSSSSSSSSYLSLSRNSAMWRAGFNRPTENLFGETVSEWVSEIAVGVQMLWAVAVRGPKVRRGTVRELRGRRTSAVRSRYHKAGEFVK
jgi:hypothetical protein